MKMSFHRFLHIVAFTLFCFLAGQAQAREAAVQPGDLKVLPLEYGANFLKIKGKDALIVRGAFVVNSIMGGDIYTVLLKEKEYDSWTMARHEKEDWSSVMTTARPRNDFDSLDSIRFLTPSDNNPTGNMTDLYLVQASREFIGPEIENTPVTLSFYQLAYPDGGGIFFKKLWQKKTRNGYCNADWALFKELKIPLPDTEANYDCSSYLK